MKNKLEELTIEELERALKEARQTVLKERFKSVTGKLENPKVIRDNKKKIARILTLKKEYELGIRTR
jgi:large subunit ribosomal protein L29